MSLHIAHAGDPVQDVLYVVILTCHVLILTPYKAFWTMMFSATTSETQARL